MERKIRVVPVEGENRKRGRLTVDETEEEEESDSERPRKVFGEGNREGEERGGDEHDGGDGELNEGARKGRVNNLSWDETLFRYSLRRRSSTRRKS